MGQNDGMASSTDPLRTQLLRLLTWEEAHVGFDKAVAGVPAAQRGVRPAGFAQSIWQLVDHLRASA